MEHIVYKYTFPDGKYYYGVSTITGLKRRHTQHKARKYLIGCWIRRYLNRDIEVEPTIHKRFKTESEALAYENEVVDLNNPNCLNECEGGGKPPTLRGEKNPMFGRTGYKHPLFGKPNPLRAEMNRKMKGEKHPFFGKTGEKHPFFGKSNPVVAERNRKQTGNKNPMWGKKGYWLGKKRPDLLGENHPMKNPDIAKKVWETRRKNRILTK